MREYKFKINDDKYTAKILEYTGDFVLVEVNGMEYKVELDQDKISKPKLTRSQKSKPQMHIKKPKSNKSQANEGSVIAPIPGLVIKLLVQEGDLVKTDQTVAILEAMKMESEITTSFEGKVKKILVKEGENIQEGQIIMEIGE